MLVATLSLELYWVLRLVGGSDSVFLDIFLSSVQIALNTQYCVQNTFLARERSFSLSTVSTRILYTPLIIHGFNTLSGGTLVTFVTIMILNTLCNRDVRLGWVICYLFYFICLWYPPHHTPHETWTSNISSPHFPLLSLDSNTKPTILDLR